VHGLGHVWAAVVDNDVVFGFCFRNAKARIVTDVLCKRCEPRIAQRDVDESRPCDVQLGKLVAVGQGVHHLLGDVARFCADLLRRAHRAVALKLTELALLRWNDRTKLAVGAKLLKSVGKNRCQRLSDRTGSRTHLGHTFWRNKEAPSKTRAPANTSNRSADASSDSVESLTSSFRWLSRVVPGGGSLRAACP